MASKKDSKTARKRKNPSSTIYTPQDLAPPSTVRLRFGATIQPGSNIKSKDWIERLDVDRVPGAPNEVRALVTPEDCVRLLDEGFEIHLQKAYPVRPLDPKLIISDEDHKASLDREVKRIKAPTP